MKKISALFFTTALMVAFTACNDPADKTQDAQVSDPNEVSAPSGGAVFALTDASNVEFTGSKVVSGSHDGGFKAVTGKIRVNEGQISADGPISIDMNSIWSDNEKLTGHLKNADFFDIEKFPTSTFTITDVKPNGDLHTVTGNLEMLGVSKSVTFDATISIEESNVSVKAEFDIDRQLWGISYTGMKDNAINDKVVLRLNVVAAAEQA